MTQERILYWLRKEYIIGSGKNTIDLGKNMSGSGKKTIEVNLLLVLSIIFPKSRSECIDTKKGNTKQITTGNVANRA